MEQRYRLSAGALLYAVCKLHKSGIYGVPQVMPRLSDRGFPAFAQEAELELLAAGCGMLSFDGEFTVEPDFAALLGSCADCRSVVGASLRRNGVWKKLTLYPAAGAILEREEDNTCVLRTAAQPMNALLEVLELPEDPEEPPLEVLVDTDLLEKRSLEGVMAAGCGEAQARMILSALDGTGGYLHLSRVENRERTGELLLVCGSEGILSADAAYSETQELLRFSPLARAEATALLRAWTKEEESNE